jgi:hypothetical protein
MRSVARGGRGRISEEAVVSDVDRPGPPDDTGLTQRDDELRSPGHPQVDHVEVSLLLLKLGQCALTSAELWRDVHAALQPSDTIDPRSTSARTLLSAASTHIDAIQDYLAALSQRQLVLAPQQHDFQQQLTGHVATIGAAVADLSTRTEPVERVRLDALGRAMLAATLGAIFCGVFGWHILPLVLHESLLRDLISAAISGAVETVAAEVAT